MLAISLAAAITLSLNLIISKTLARRGVDGRYIGFNFLLVEGTLGVICLLVATALGEGLYTISVVNLGLMMIAGVSGVSAIALLSYSISIGIVGVVCSIFNLNGAFFAAMCFIFLD